MVYDRYYVLVGETEGGDIEALLMSTVGMIEIAEHTKENEVIRKICIPIADDYSLALCEAIERNSVTGKKNYFTPLEYPDDPSVQQGYARVLQNTLKDALSIARKPTQLPPELNL